MDTDSPTGATLSALPPDSEEENPIQDRETNPRRLPEHLQKITSLGAYAFMEYMDEIGWPQDGTFVTLLPTFGYHFHKQDGRIVTRRPWAWAVQALSNLIFELLPFDVSITPLPQLPTEVWEYIIDCIAPTPKPSDLLPDFTIHACALVCRSWRDRSRLHLYKKLRLTQKGCISKLQTTLRNNPGPLASYIETIEASTGRSISALFSMSKFTNFYHFTIAFLRLTDEHRMITQGPLAWSVTILKLRYLSSCPVTIFLRFINSFKSLTELHVHFVDGEDLSYVGQVLPPPRPASNCFLKNLNVQVVPGLDRWIEWYIREGYFLSRLQKLVLSWWPALNDSLCFEGRMSLLDHCANTLEEMTLIIPLPEEITTTDGGTSTHTGPIMIG